MRDLRLEQLARGLIHYSVRLQKGEKVLIEAFDVDHPLLTALVDEAFAVGGYPFVQLHDTRVDRALLRRTDETHSALAASYDLPRMKDMDAYIGVRGARNTSENSDVPSTCASVHARLYGQPVHSDARVGGTKWVILRYPNESMAQAAGMSSDAFEDFYFSVCNLDYSKMDRTMDALKSLMERTDKVRIVSPGTDLSFSIKGIPAIKCAGEMNIPDGEVYTAPVRDSVNGTIAYNAPSVHDGIRHENVCLTFERGRIVKATGNHTAELNAVFDTDEGARYVGEFAIGVNPYVTKPMGDILFDEKIAGSIHFTPGACYDDASNGNDSALHWDLVLIQTPEYGGGEIYFDGVLIRKDGRFVLKELEGLNPENLK